MAKEKIQFPSKVDKTQSFMERIMGMFNRNSKLINTNGRVTYIEYPLKDGLFGREKDFSKKQKENTEVLEINDVLIFGEKPDYRYQELKNAKKLVLGKGVLGIAVGALGNAQFEELELSEDVTMIPEGAIRDSKIRRITGPKFDISTDSKNINTSFYIDEDGRPHFIEEGHYSLGPESHLLEQGKKMSEETRYAALALAKRMLASTDKRENVNSLFVYAPYLESDTRYSVHGVLDKFPMPDESYNRIPAEKLIGILVNGVEELNLEDLKKYPNLMRVIIGKDVKRVIPAKDTEEVVILDQDKKPIKLMDDKRQVYEQKTSSGFSQRITLSSESTILLKPKQTKDVEQEKPLERAAEEFSKKGIEDGDVPEME